MTTRRSAIGLLMFCAVAHASGQERIKNFDHDKVGGAPQGWISSGEPWRVAEEPQASSKPNVLTPPNSVLSGGSLSQLMLSSTSFLNGDVGVRFRITREDPSVVFGLLWSYVNPANFEEIEINTQSNTVTMLIVKDGKPHELTNDTLIFTPNTWHLIQLQAAQKQLTLFLDNETILTKKVSSRKYSGMVGLLVVPNSPIQFDDFAWREN